MSDTRRHLERFCDFIEQNYKELWHKAGSYALPDYPAEDLLHNAVRRAMDHLDPEKGENWLRLLCRIMCWLRLDHIRRRAGAPVVLAGDITTDENADLIASAACEMPSPYEFSEQLGDAQLVKKALARMQNEQQRCVLELVLENFTVDGQPNLKKVAEDMNISHSNAKKLFERAKDALKQSLRQFAKEMNIPTERPNHEP